MPIMMPTNLQPQFGLDGFSINRSEPLPEGVVRRAREGMDAIRRGEYDTGRAPEGSPWNPGDSENVLCKIEQPQLASKGVLELISHPTIGRWAAAATGAKRIQVWWVQLLYKPPTPRNAKFVTNVGWHQDRSYWGNWTPQSELLTAWVALTDVTLDSGPMVFVRGSNQWGLQPDSSDFWGQDLEAIKSKASIPPGQQWEEIPATVPPGGFTLHHDLTWHGSGPNRSAIPRRSFAIHLRTEKSQPTGDKRDGLAKYIDDPSVCPWIYP
jgi:hypothetical protein